MTDQMIVQHCSPTLEGMKTGSMFPCSYTSRGKPIEQLAVAGQIREKKKSIDNQKTYCQNDRGQLELTKYIRRELVDTNHKKTVKAVTEKGCNMMPLTLAVVGEENIIKRIGGRKEVKTHLENLGFVAGGAVTVISKIGGNVIVNVKSTRIAISQEMAQKIMI